MRLKVPHRERMDEVLRLVDEIALLMRRDEDLSFTHVPTLSLRYGLAGAVLMDLAIENRIDTDLQRLAVIDPTPVGDDIPDPRDVMLVCLADACGAFEDLLARGEFADVIPRLEQLRKLELIGRAVFEAIEDSQVAMAASMMHQVV